MSVHKKKKVVAKKNPNRQIIVTSPVSPDSRIMVSAELADDNMIEKELMGEALPYFIYQFDQDGKTISGLTVKGVSEVVRRLNRNPKSGYKIRINPQYLIREEKTYDNQKGIEVSVFAEDLITGNSGWGIKFEPYVKVGKRGNYANTFAIEKALSKAERNAKRKLIPETTAVKMIEKLIDESKGKTVNRLSAPPETTRVIESPKPVATAPEEMEQRALSMIDKAVKIPDLMLIDERVQANNIFSDDFKKKVHDLCAKKANSLEK